MDRKEKDPLAPPTQRETLVPAMTVAAIAIIALTAAVMVKRGDTAQTREVAQQQKPATPVADANVVQAPPLKAPDTKAMGGAPACKECGVVQVVVAVFDRGGTEPRAYQMHVRMDDGTVRMVEQRGALAAGSRVVVDGDSLKPMS